MKIEKKCSTVKPFFQTSMYEKLSAEEIPFLKW